MAGVHSSLTVTFIYNPKQGASPADPGAFTLRRSGGDVSQQLTVPFALSGTAQQGSDYVSPVSPITFAANQTDYVLPISVVNDLIPEAAETVVLTLSQPTGSPPAYQLGTPNQQTATVTINDDDIPPTLSITGTTVREGTNSPTTPAVFHVTLSHPTGLDVTVHVDTVGGSATEGLDYTGQHGTITIITGQTEAPLPMTTVPVLDDQLVEPTENFFVQLTNPVNAVFAENQQVAAAEGKIGTARGQRKRRDKPVWSWE